MNKKKPSLPFYLVSKYLRFDKSQPFITISAILAFLGVSIGLMVLIVAMAIMNGTKREFEKKLFTMNYPLTIFPKTKETPLDLYVLKVLKKKFPDLKFSPYISTQMIIKKGDKLEGGMLFGVDFEKEKEINEVIAKAIKSKKLKKFDLIVGKGIAESFLFKEGSKATLIFTQTQPGGMSLIPTMKRFTVRGVFESGLHAYDKVYNYTSLSALRTILHYPKNTYEGIHVYSKDPFKDKEKLEKFVSPNFGVIGWWQLNGNFFSAMEMEKKALFIVLMLIILVASLNIISSLLMTVMNRRHEIALLLSLGASKEEIKKTFFTLGMTIGGSGIVFGTILGFLGLFLLGNFDIVTLPKDVYGTSKLPLDLSFTDFLSILTGAVIIVVLSSYYPAKKATEVDILKTLRHE